MYKANMHITPLKVRARVCELLEKNHEELVHLSHGSMLEGDNSYFMLIAYDVKCNPFDKYPYSVYEFDPEEDTIYIRLKNLSYPDALIKMGEIIKE